MPQVLGYNALEGGMVDEITSVWVIGTEIDQAISNAASRVNEVLASQ
jgi:hypothetical protein